MSKTKGSSKVQWAAIDKRVRDRRGAWHAGEFKDLEAQLARLPDVAEQADIIDINQPAVGRREAQSDGQAGADPGAGAADAATKTSGAGEGAD